MKNIKINRPVAFAACQLAQSNDKKRPYLTGVHIEPSGRVTGTNGHIAVTCNDVVEPFDGSSIILRAKTLPKRQALKCDCRIAFDGEASAMIICEDKEIVKTKLPRTIFTGEIIKGDFPCLDGIMPEYRDDDSLNRISFNSSYITPIAERFDPFESVVKFKMKDAVSPIEVTFSGPESEGVKMILMPMRI